MQQPCSRCGYISDRPARFCRQCGAQLTSETDLTSAVTQNYEARRTGGSAAEAPRSYSSPVQDYPPETARFYQPPAGQAYPPMYSNYSVTPPPRKSSAAPWLIVLFMVVLLAGGGLIGIVSYFSKSRNPRNAPPTAEQVADEERQRIQAEIEQAMQEAQQAIDEAKQNAAEAAREGAPPPAPPPPPPAPGSNGLPAGLEKYRYDKAEIVTTSSFLGNDVVHMQTSDSIEKVHDFYRKLAGAPIVSSKDTEGQKYIFQVTASPPIVIILNPNDEDPDKTSIQIARSKFVPNLK